MGKRALLVIDVQNEYFKGDLKIRYPEHSHENIVKCVSAAKNEGIPVVFVQHTSKGGSHFARNTDLWEIHKSLDIFEPDLLVEKNYPGSFTGTKLEESLKKLGVGTITVTGFMTHMCCDTTARQAFHRNFSVEFISDATGTIALENGNFKMDAENLHKAILAVQSSGFSKVLTANGWIGAIGNST